MSILRSQIVVELPLDHVVETECMELNHGRLIIHRRGDLSTPAARAPSQHRESGDKPEQPHRITSGLSSNSRIPASKADEATNES